MTHHIVNLFYEPTEQAKKLYDGLEDALFLNAGSLETSQEEWVKKNVTFEKQFPDNIADNNRHFCECTAFYAVWKNLCPKWDDNDWIQFSHFRKFLEIPQQLDPRIDLYIANPYNLVFNMNGERKCLNIQDATLLCHPQQSWRSMEEVMVADGTFRELEWWKEWKMLNVMPAPMNLFCMKVGLFKDYCEWVFPKLFKIEKKIPYEDPSYKMAYQQRAIAFISERLFSFWCFCQVRRGRRLIQVGNTIYEDFKPIPDALERKLEKNTFNK